MSKFKFINKVQVFIFFMLILSFSAFAQKNIMIGEWEQFEYGAITKYSYLKINKDLSGTYVTIRDDNKPVIDNFNVSDVKSRDGYIEIKFDEADLYKATIILSAYSGEMGKKIA